MGGFKEARRGIEGGRGGIGAEFEEEDGRALERGLLEERREKLRNGRNADFRKALEVGELLNEGKDVGSIRRACKPDVGSHHLLQFVRHGSCGYGGAVPAR